MARYFCNKCRGRHSCTCASSAQSAFATETVNKVVTIPIAGKSNYQLWLEQGNTGTVEEYLQWIAEQAGTTLTWEEFNI